MAEIDSKLAPSGQVISASTHLSGKGSEEDVSKKLKAQASLGQPLTEEKDNSQEIKALSSDPNKKKPSPEGKDGATNLFSMIVRFVKNQGVTITTALATGLNFISAPIWVLNLESPFKHFINKASMLASKLHLVACAISGIEAAVEKKNPILIASYAMEGLSALISNVRTLYLTRGIATALDALPAAYEDHTSTEPKFNSYWEGFTKSMDNWKTMLKEFFDDITVVTKKKGHLLGISSVATIFGSLFGLIVNDKVGGSIRDFSGAFSDLGMLIKDDNDAKQSGRAYLFGSFFDFIARFFSKDTAGLFSRSAEFGRTFENIRNAFHELAIALDRVGQLFYLRYNQKSGPEEPASKIAALPVVTEKGVSFT